jgi:hypothetical protein
VRKHNNDYQLHLPDQRLAHRGRHRTNVALLPVAGGAGAVADTGRMSRQAPASGAFFVAHF